MTKKKTLFLILFLFLLFVTNNITQNLTRNKIKSDFSKSVSDCFLKSSPNNDIELSEEFNENGLYLKVSNNSDCINIEHMILTIVSKNGQYLDTINLDINEVIKSNYDANIQLNKLKIDSIISSSFLIKRISL